MQVVIYGQMKALERWKAYQDKVELTGTQSIKGTSTGCKFVLWTN